jgi:hypothetical protein
LEPLLDIEPDVIRQIAARHPRFAAIIAGIRTQRGLNAARNRVYWSPVEITQKDVEWWLRPNAESALYLESLKTKAEQANRLVKQGKASAGIYELTVEQPARSETVTLVLRTVRGTVSDPPYSWLQIDFVDSAKQGAHERLWTVIGWRIE